MNTVSLRRWDMFPPFVLGVAGPIGSGKSTLVKSIADEANVTTASYGQYFRNIAFQRGIHISRNNLQSLTEELLGALGHNVLARNLVDSTGWSGSNPLIVDGIRYIETIDAVKKATSPTKFALVFMNVSEEERLRRVSIRDNIEEKQQLAFDNHSSEIDARKNIMRHADLVLDGSDVSLNLDQLFKFLFQRFCGGTSEQ